MPQHVGDEMEVLGRVDFGDHDAFEVRRAGEDGRQVLQGETGVHGVDAHGDFADAGGPRA